MQRHYLVTRSHADLGWEPSPMLQHGTHCNPAEGSKRYQILCCALHICALQILSVWLLRLSSAGLRSSKWGVVRIRRPGFDSHFHHWKWTWLSWLISLCSSFLICKMGILLFLHSFSELFKALETGGCLSLFCFYFVYKNLFGSQTWLDSKDLMTKPTLNGIESISTSEFLKTPDLSVLENRLCTHNSYFIGLS